MTLDHVSLAGIVMTTLDHNALVANVTQLQNVGSRNPKASFTVVGNNGAVLQVEIKRLMKGQADPEPEPEPSPRQAPRKTRKESKK